MERRLRPIRVVLRAHAGAASGKPRECAADLKARADFREAIATTRHLLQLFQAQLQDLRARHKLRRLTQRLLNISRELNQLGQNACTLAGQ